MLIGENTGCLNRPGNLFQVEMADVHSSLKPTNHETPGSRTAAFSPQAPRLNRLPPHLVMVMVAWRSCYRQITPRLRHHAKTPIWLLERDLHIPNPSCSSSAAPGAVCKAPGAGTSSAAAGPCACGRRPSRPASEPSCAPLRPRRKLSRPDHVSDRCSSGACLRGDRHVIVPSPVL